MAKHNESQRAEAYRIYMSDSLFSLNTMLSGKKFPRYLDLYREANDQEPKEKPLTEADVIEKLSPLIRS